MFANSAALKSYAVLLSACFNNRLYCQGDAGAVWGTGENWSEVIFINSLAR